MNYNTDASENWGGTRPLKEESFTDCRLKGYPMSMRCPIIIQIPIIIHTEPIMSPIITSSNNSK